MYTMNFFSHFCNSITCAQTLLFPRQPRSWLSHTSPQALDQHLCRCYTSQPYRIRDTPCKIYRIGCSTCRPTHGLVLSRRWSLKYRRVSLSFVIKYAKISLTLLHIITNFCSTEFVSPNRWPRRILILKARFSNVGVLSIQLFCHFLYITAFSFFIMKKN
jgi:hypothetical protein